MDPARAAAILTAAGMSSRMGQPKGLLDWQGRALIAHQCAILAGLFGHVAVVLGHGADALRPRIPAHTRVSVHFNPDYREGRSTSIEAGARALPPEAPEGPWEGVLIVGIDQPLDADVTADLAARFDPSRWRFGVPTYEGRRGHPLLASADVLPDLLRAHTFPEGLRSLLHRDPATVCELPMATPQVRLDINTLDDYRAALE